jgi:hypothetical protein
MGLWTGGLGDGGGTEAEDPENLYECLFATFKGSVENRDPPSWGRLTRKDELFWNQP